MRYLDYTSEDAAQAAAEALCEAYEPRRYTVTPVQTARGRRLYRVCRLHRDGRAVPVPWTSDRTLYTRTERARDAWQARQPSQASIAFAGAFYLLSSRFDHAQ